MIGFFRHYKKKSQNIIVVREITFAQSLDTISVIICYFGIRQPFRNSATISEFGNHFGIRQPFWNSATISDIGFGNSDFGKSENNFGDHPYFDLLEVAS